MKEHKLDKYILRQGGIFYDHSTDWRSRYYKLCVRNIRVSNHINKNTKDIEYQIIIVGEKYLLYHVRTGTVFVNTYKQIKEFIRNFKYFSTFGADIEDVEVLVGTQKNILGVPAEKFTPAQLKQILTFIKTMPK